MNPDSYHYLARLRGAELRAEAAEFRLARAPRPARPGARTRLGWSLVELGLRVLPAPTPAAPRTA